MPDILPQLILLVGGLAAVGIGLCLLDKLVMKFMPGAGGNQP